MSGGKKKTVIVTGASRGIGRGIALVLARDEGHTVCAPRADRVPPAVRRVF